MAHYAALLLSLTLIVTVVTHEYLQDNQLGWIVKQDSTLVAQLSHVSRDDEINIFLR